MVKSAVRTVHLALIKVSSVGALKVIVNQPLARFGAGSLNLWSEVGPLRLGVGVSV